MITTPIAEQKSKNAEHLFARVSWYDQHPRQEFYPYPLHVVTTVCEPEGPASFIPVSRIVSRCAITEKQVIQFDYGEDSVYVICPLIKYKS